MVPSRTPNTVVSEETAVFAGSEIRPSSAPQATRFRTKKIRESDGLVVLAYLWPGLVGFTPFILVPLLGSLLISMFQWPLFGSATFIGFANSQKMFSDPTFCPVLVNTVIFAFVYTALNLLLALAVSLWLNTKI